MSKTFGRVLIATCILNFAAIFLDWHSLIKAALITLQFCLLAYAHFTYYKN